MSRTRTIIARSLSETALEYKPRILGLKNKEFLFLVHKLSVIQTAPQYKNGVKNIQTAGYNGARTVLTGCIYREYIHFYVLFMWHLGTAGSYFWNYVPKMFC